jgi:CBS domain-containing protein
MNIASLLASKGAKVVTIAPQDSIRAALSLLAEHNIGALVVVEGRGPLVGIVSERDIVRALARADAILVEPVARIMTREVVVGTPQDDLVAVGNTMTERRIRHLPIVERDALVGIVSIGDIVKAQRDQYQGEVDTLQFQLLREDDMQSGKAF